MLELLFTPLAWSMGILLVVAIAAPIIQGMR